MNDWKNFQAVKKEKWYVLSIDLMIVLSVHFDNSGSIHSDDMDTSLN